MKALIFNSGLGKRMGEFTQGNHKSMARIGTGETIFGRQLRLLADAGVTEFIVTTGPFADQLHAETRAPHLAGLSFTFVPNDVYDRTNYIYSMYLAREHLDDDLLMLHGDLVFNRGALDRLLADPRPDLGMVNDALPQPEKDFKARVVDGTIREVSVSIHDDDCHAFQPLYKLSRRAIGVWLRRVAEFVERGETSVYAENALNEVAEEADVRAFSYVADSVNEVDTLDDLAAVAAQVRLFDFDEQPVLSDADSYRGIPALLRSLHAERPLVVGGRSFDASFVKSFLDEEGVEYVRFDGYSPNPKLEEVHAGLARYRQENCDAIISLGGGSAIDVAKCIKLLAAAEADVFPATGAPLPRLVPHLSIPTTAGTGSESTHFAVVYIDGEKHSIAHDAIIPDAVVLEPRLLESLPEYHKKASLLDALSQCIESSWSRGATDQSRDYATRGIQLILDNLFAYFHRSGFDLEAARQILIASNLGGKAINLTKTTAPHAMSYKMTSLYGTAHGHAVALCLVGVWRHYIKLTKNAEPGTEILAPALESLTAVFDASSPLNAVRKFQLIIEFLGLTAPALRDPSDIDELVGSVNQERLGNSPVTLSDAEIRYVYEYVFGLRPFPYVDEAAEEKFAHRRLTPAQKLADLQALHAYELEILDEFDRFCGEHGLKYYLSEGTILGAVRHGGIIPWDDDVDVMMPRADYRRLVELATSGALGDHYHLGSYETNKKHWVFGAKLELTRETEFHLPKVAHLAHFGGPYIDIFPVDAVTRTSGPVFAAQALLLRALRRMLFMSAGRSRGLRRNLVVRVPLYIVASILPTPAIHRLIVWTQSRFNSSPEATHWANLCTYYPIHREVFPREWFGEGRRVPFADGEYVIPTMAERMLESIYGPNWGKLPGRNVVVGRSHAFAVDRELAERLRGELID